MNDGGPFRSAAWTAMRPLRCAWPAMLLVTLILVPFLKTAFTIDDPLYLREAQHVLVDPLHPQAFDIVWSTDMNLRAAQILPGGLAVPYLLVPIALANWAEWAGHLLQMIMLLAALYGTALVGLRIGMDEAQARSAALLTGTCPAVLGMAGTIMPDVAAMLFVVLGVERILAFREHRKWWQAVLAAVCLALAALTRVHTILILPAAFVLLLDGITIDELRKSLLNFPARFLPLLLAPLLFYIVSSSVADPEVEGNNILASMAELPVGFRLHLLSHNSFAFLAHLVFVVPLVIPWIALRFRQIPYALLLISLLGGIALSFRVGWVAYVAAAGCVVLLDIVRDAIQRRDGLQLALWLWLFLALPMVIYVHLPSKYLLPSMPAVALLLVRRFAKERSRPFVWVLNTTATAGAVLGLLILLAARDLAETQRRAVADLIVPYTKGLQHVWFSGHWGFQWYAEAAGATPVTVDPPFPKPADVIVVSRIDRPVFAQAWTSRRIVQRASYPNAFGRVMDFDAGAGFFSNGFGYLPWVPGSGEANSFEVWRVE